MPRIFVGNFEFEHELIHGPRELGRQAKAVAADLVSAWIAIADEADIIWSPTGIPDFDFQEVRDSGLRLPHFVASESQLPRGPEWELVPWGWTPELKIWGERFRWACPSPAADVVRRVNSRTFRWQLEAELGVALAGSNILMSLDEVVSHMAAQPADASWVLKANYGMSGRERCLGRGSRLTESNLNWVRKRLELGGLVYEPWLNRIAEAGIQWQVPSSGEPQLVGVTPLLTDASGTYRGSWLSATDEYNAGVSWQSAIEVTRLVAHKLQQAGYFGAVGIDAMWYSDRDGVSRCRPLQDLNARFSMGRLALGWRRLLPAGIRAAWLHHRGLVEELIARSPDARAIQTTTNSWLVIWSWQN